jgi:hypothetical protein
LFSLRNGLMVRGRQGSFDPVKTGQTSRFHMENRLRTKMPCWKYWAARFAFSFSTPWQRHDFLDKNCFSQYYSVSANG